jgi:hypothetical protein
MSNEKQGLALPRPSFTMIDITRLNCEDMKNAKSLFCFLSALRLFAVK